MAAYTVRGGSPRPRTTHQRRYNQADDNLHPSAAAAAAAAVAATSHQAAIPPGPSRPDPVRFGICMGCVSYPYSMYPATALRCAGRARPGPDGRGGR